MILRSYQARAIAGLREAFYRGKRAPILVAPTGSGKTVIGASCAAGHVARGGTVTWYAHRRELLVQAADTMRERGLEVGIFGEGASAPVQLHMTQTAVSRREVREASLVVIDEAHHAAADLWLEVPQAHKSAGAQLLGLTATPERGDGRGLGPLFDHIVVAAQVGELVQSGSLVPCEVIGPKRKVPRGKLARHPLAAYQEFGGGRRNIVFCPNLKAAREWCADFVAAGVAAEVVWGTMPADEREAVLARLRSGHTRVVLNVYVLTEGFDCPEVGVVTIARPVGSSGAWIQMAGRGARPAPGKTSYTLLDLRGAAEVHGKPSDDREYSLEGIGVSSGTGTGVIGERLCKRCKFAIGEVEMCPRCEFDNGLEVPGDADIALGRWDRKREVDDSDDKRAAQLARWLRKFPGRKPAFYSWRYKAVYGHFAPPTVVALAMRMVRDG